MNQADDDASDGGNHLRYSCRSISWDERQGRVEGSSDNFVDARLCSKDGRQLFTVRGDRWDERWGSVSSRDISLISVDEQSDCGDLCSSSLHKILKRPHDPSSSSVPFKRRGSISNEYLDRQIFVRFQTTFIPLHDNEDISDLEIAPQAYNFESLGVDDPKNILLFCTNQGLITSQQDEEGEQNIYHNTDDRCGTVQRFWMSGKSSTDMIQGPRLAGENVGPTKKNEKKSIFPNQHTMGIQDIIQRNNLLMIVQVPLEIPAAAELTPHAPMATDFFGSVSPEHNEDYLSEDYSLTESDSSDDEDCDQPSRKRRRICDESSVSENSSNTDHSNSKSTMNMLCEPELTLFIPPINNATSPTYFGSDEESVATYWIENKSHRPPSPTRMRTPPGIRRKMIYRKMSHLLPNLAHSISEDQSEGKEFREPLTVSHHNANPLKRNDGYSSVDMWSGLAMSPEPRRHPSKHVKTTITIYYACSGVEPTEQEVKDAIDELESLYQSVERKDSICSFLSDENINLMTSRLTMKDDSPMGSPCVANLKYTHPKSPPKTPTPVHFTF